MNIIIDLVLLVFIKLILVLLVITLKHLLVIKGQLLISIILEC